MPPLAPFTRTPTESDLRGDLWLAMILFGGGILSAALTSIAQIYGDEQAPLWTALVLALFTTLPLAVRRRWPGFAAVVVSLAYFVGVTFKVPELYIGNIAVFIGLYTIGAWMSDRRRALLVRVAIIVGMAFWLVTVMYRSAIEQAAEEKIVAGALSPYLAYMMLQLLLNALYFGGAYYFGERSWNAAGQRSALEQRTAELEREREVNAAQAVALDRVRIARELHDVVAHHVSVMGVQAGAARLTVDRDPAAAKRILVDVEAASREAIHDFRQLLETLRTPGNEEDEPSSTVTMADIGTLAAASSSAGLPTEYTVIGQPTSVPALITVNLYRIAQESLTNARRHAGPDAVADVRVRYTGGTVELEVVNTGRVVTGLRPGLGQLGMRERALASGGTIELTPRPAGGFRVRATVPLAPQDDTAERARPDPRDRSATEGTR
ncbi:MULTISPECIES: sensor histidine kinase [Bacteria]|uniref:sensor histidine kinase n=1 Tax=Bacteria TaxID=2 RepID=UPI003C7E6609